MRVPTESGASRGHAGGARATGGTTRPGAPAFFALTFAWSWSAFALAVALGGEWPEPRALVPWGVGALGPAVAAFALTRRSVGAAGVRALLRSTLAFRRIGRRWWAAIAAVALFPNAAAIAALTALGRGVPTSVTDVEVTPLVSLAVVLFAFAAGFAEEPGWRGYALERLGGRPLLAASLLVGVAWSLWHLPYFLIEGTFQHELGFGGELWWFLLQILPNAVLLGWIYVRTGHLVAAAVGLHALGNATGELLPLAGGGRWLALAFVAALATGVVVWERRLFLTPFEPEPSPQRREARAPRASGRA